MLEIPRQQRTIAFIFLIFFLAGYLLWGWEYLSRKTALTVNDLSAMMSEENRLTVHVAGAVNKPGVYQAVEGTRVYQVLEMAGGAREYAVTDCLNLAAKVEDGQQIYVPSQNEYEEYKKNYYKTQTLPVNTNSSLPQAPSSPAATIIAQHMQINTMLQKRIRINEASAKELESLPGIGPAMAGRIIAYRNKNGPFQQIADLLNVKGIGPKKLEQLAPWVIIP